MAAVAPTELLRQWELEQITSEMAIGQLIQNQVKQQELLESNSHNSNFADISLAIRFSEFNIL